MPFLLGFLKVAWPYLLGALVLGVGYYKVNHWCNAACVTALDRAVTAEGTLEAVKKREAAIASLWAAQVDKTEAAARVAEGKRNETFDGIADRARRVAPGASLRLDPGTLGVFRDASENANAARPPAVDQKPTPAVPPATEVSESALALWAVEAARAYSDAYSRWAACVSFYEDLQHVQSTKEP